MKAEQRRARRGDKHNDDYRYVVILTYGRTGSTVLQAALNSVDDVCVRGENYGVGNHLEKLFKAAARTRTEQSGGVTTDTISPWYGAHLIEPESLLEALRRVLIEQVLRPESGTRVLGFKEIRHTPDYFDTIDDLLAYALFLDRLLPGVQFVINTRNSEDTSKSGWWRDDPAALQLLERSRDWMLELPGRIEAKLGPGRVVRMNYDDWNGNPQALQDMLLQLGLNGDLSRLTEVSGRRLSHMQAK